ncbi:hypothetical protein KUTeg_014531 [Tegillarca granosa]|uniref:HTH psq-type domain-containing protein n=1 Tax=Tegillarca granosa TaxID=220873 RepID=A0ABQ9EWF2_TEGGR|nr:hypothetical protein KUTeg_014531 [Tegillarca granosa]
MFHIKLKDAESRRPTQYRQYSPTAVTNAMEKIRAKEVSIYKAFKIYNIPETTLLCAMSDFVDKLENKIGKDNVKCFVKKRNSLSKVVAGKAITKDIVMRDITEHCERQRASSKKGKKSVVNCNQPGPSDLQKIVIFDDELSSDASDEDEEKCCVCGKSTPDAFKKKYLAFDIKLVTLLH